MGIYKSFAEYEKAFRNFSKNISQKLVLQNEKDRQYYRGVARRKAPVKTGLLRQGIVTANIKTTDLINQWSLISKRPSGAKSPYNIFQEMGYTHHFTGKKVRAKEFMIDTYLLMAKKIPKTNEETVARAVFDSFK